MAENGDVEMDGFSCLIPDEELDAWEFSYAKAG